VCPLLQDGGQRGGRPQGRVELLRGRGRGPERPGMEPHTEADTLVSGLHAAGGRLLQALAQLYGCQHRPPRVVLVRDRGPKQPHRSLGRGAPTDRPGRRIP
jgi:hypothetical protein